MAKTKTIETTASVKADADPRDILRIEGLLLAFCFGGQGLAKIADHEIAKMRKGFDYDNVSGMEKAIIDRIVLCWMRLQKWEFARASFDISGSHPKADIEFVERQLHLAHARYLRAIEELAKVQFLMSRTNMQRLQIVRDTMKRNDAPEQGPGKLLELKAG